MYDSEAAEKLLSRSVQHQWSHFSTRWWRKGTLVQPIGTDSSPTQFDC